MGLQHFPIHRNTHTQHLEYIETAYTHGSDKVVLILSHTTISHFMLVHTRTRSQLHTFSHSQASINSMANYIREMIRHLNESESRAPTHAPSKWWWIKKAAVPPPPPLTKQKKKHGLDVSYIYKFCAAIFLAAFFRWFFMCLSYYCIRFSKQKQKNPSCSMLSLAELVIFLSSSLPIPLPFSLSQKITPHSGINANKNDCHPITSRKHRPKKNQQTNNNPVKIKINL